MEFTELAWANEVAKNGNDPSATLGLLPLVVVDRDNEQCITIHILLVIV